MGFAQAQDAHYSQFNNAPLFLNPALTGSMDAKNRLGINFRNQWRSIKDPYRNIGAFFDTKGKLFAIGLLLNQNDAGEASFKNTHALLSIALRKKLAEGNNILSFGGQFGFAQHRINPEQLTFDNQYNPDLGYDPSLGSNESFEQTTLILPDANIGLSWTFNVLRKNKVGGTFGVSFSHINNPSASFYNDNVKYNIKTIFHGRLNVRLTEDIAIEPKLLFKRQNEAKELTIGADAVYNLNSYSNLKFGIANRRADAFIFYGGIDYKNIAIGLSYDSNSSKLKSVTSGNGAIELSAMILFPRKFEPSEKELSDKDMDGVLDIDDDCPEVPGIPARNGCPELMAKVKNDMDKDGITDENDLCPYQPGLIKYQGCNDTDADGVWDHVDACPTIPGDKDNYGCPLNAPDIDSDGDGVYDKHDKCVYMRGLPELDGCPDSDRDGVPDTKDNCPYIKGEIHLNGCPQEGIPSTREELSINNVLFDTDKAIIKRHYFPMLDKLAYELMFNDTYILQLDGHTDNEGNHLYNFNLSQRRCIVIQDYLISKGVHPERIRVAYYGETKPADNNNTENGKAMNRRTEIILLKAF